MSGWRDSEFCRDPEVPESPIETDRGKAKIFETIPNLSGAHFTIRIIIENVAPTGCESEIVGKPVRNFGIDEYFGSAGLIVGKIGTKIGPLAIIRSEEHTSELQSLMRISYAVLLLK